MFRDVQRLSAMELHIDVPLSQLYKPSFLHVVKMTANARTFRERRSQGCPEKATQYR